MFGDIFRCTKCEFDFSTGWSHHASGAFCVCVACGTQFVITGRSEWGPGERERCELVHLGGDGPTGAFATALESGTMSPHGSPLPGFNFSDVRCPACGALEQFRLTLTDGSPCPRCKEGRVEYHGAAVY
jgi:hypothetical protein